MAAVINWLFKPSPEINYDVIAMLYAFGSGLSVLFYALEKVMGSETYKEAEIVKENIDSIKGIYLVFCPFLPCLLWGLMMRYMSKKEMSAFKHKED
mmetsp:Transcript_15101/g.23444  ORF Transcript_15101/g.23444 Transcript_15101/m.23444 type:complete len:96 (+) Transcript_15101:56-343(+)